MEFQLDDALEVLERTPAALAGLLDGIGPGWQGANEGPETWSPVDVVAHLIHGEEIDWVPRARIILERGRSGRSIRSTAGRISRASRKWPLPALLDLFGELRRETWRPSAAET